MAPGPRLAPPSAVSRPLSPSLTFRCPLPSPVPRRYTNSGFRQFAAAVRASVSLQSLTLAGELALPLLQMKGTGAAVAPRDDASVVSRDRTAPAASKTLDLSSQDLDPLAGILIGALVSQHTSLTELSLHNNAALGPEGARAVCDKVNPATLKVLDLNAVIQPATPNTPKAKRQLAQLERLGTCLGRLSSLEKLTLDKNSLVEFSSAGQLHDLKFLTLNNNRIESLPEEICFIRSLKRLAVRYNRLLELPAAVGQLESLESLDLKNNRLTYLPASIGQLCYLKHLDLSENSLSQLDACICDCSRLDRFEVKQNPLSRPPIALAKQGMQAIRRYFQVLWSPSLTVPSPSLACSRPFSRPSSHPFSRLLSPSLTFSSLPSPSRCRCPTSPASGPTCARPPAPGPTP